MHFEWHITKRIWVSCAEFFFSETKWREAKKKRIVWHTKHIVKMMHLACLICSNKMNESAFPLKMCFVVLLSLSTSSFARYIITHFVASKIVMYLKSKIDRACISLNVTTIHIQNATDTIPKNATNRCR